MKPSETLHIHVMDSFVNDCERLQPNSITLYGAYNLGNREGGFAGRCFSAGSGTACGLLLTALLMDFAIVAGGVGGVGIPPTNLLHRLMAIQLRTTTVLCRRYPDR